MDVPTSFIFNLAREVARSRPIDPGHPTRPKQTRQTWTKQIILSAGAWAASDAPQYFKRYASDLLSRSRLRM
jgi:hypothetical protein